MSYFRIQIVINFRALFYFIFININILNILFFVIIVIIFFIIHKLVIWIILFINNFMKFFWFYWFVSLVMLYGRSWWVFGWFFFEERRWNFFENFENAKKSILFLFLFWTGLEINFDILFKYTLWSLSEKTIFSSSILKLTHIP